MGKQVLVQLFNKNIDTGWTCANPRQHLVLSEAPQFAVSDLKKSLLGAVAGLYVGQVVAVASHQLVEHSSSGDFHLVDGHHRLVNLDRLLSLSLC